MGTNVRWSFSFAAAVSFSYSTGFSVVSCLYLLFLAEKFLAGQTFSALLGMILHFT